MAKRKNLWQYRPAVAGWDRLVGLDHRTGECPALDDSAAAKELNLVPERDLPVLEKALENIVEGFKTHPSCPALDTARGIIDEARAVGLLSIEAAMEKESVVTAEWERWREEIFP